MEGEGTSVARARMRPFFQAERTKAIWRLGREDAVVVDSHTKSALTAFGSAPS